jgi:Domain of unknown function (DUF4342)
MRVVITVYIRRRRPEVNIGRGFLNPAPGRAVLRNMDQGKTFKESFKVAADQLVDAVKKLVHEGNVRRIVIKQEGRTVAEFPMTVGVVGAVVAPVLAAVGALAAVLTECTIEVERDTPQT